MTEMKQKAFAAWLDGQIALCKERRQALLTDERRDEATFEKVRANVYDICRTLFAVAQRTCEGDAEAASRFFLLKTGQIPQSWAAAYERAKRHGDAEKMAIEKLKLETVEEVKAAFTAMEEGMR